MKTPRRFTRTRLLSHLRIAFAGVLVSAAATMALFATVAGPNVEVNQVLNGSFPENKQNPDWARNPRIDAAGDLVIRRLNGSLSAPSGPSHQGTPCAAVPSATGNVQVNCLAEDDGSPQNTQSETSVAASGNKVVVGFNDSLVCCIPALNLTGYSVSTNTGTTFTDKGDLPWKPTVQPIGDPAVAHDASGNFYFASLALGSDGLGAHSLISFYKMPAGTNTFQLVSVPVDVGSGENFFADKEYLAVAPDGNGQLHFYITWTFFSRAPQSPIMLTDSTDGVHWRTTMVSGSLACAQGSNPVPNGGTLYVSWEESVPEGCTNANITAANERMATVDVASGTVLGITTIAPVKGSGDKIVACNNPQDLRQVIETQIGHDARNFEMPSTTIDHNGVLYAVWNDRPDGVGGNNANATRIFLSFSRDGNKTWSTPQQISASPNTVTMNDRFQPWITADSTGLHAMWYDRVPRTPVDLIQTNKEDLSLATATVGPVPAGEVRLSTVAFPIVQTNPQQDPIISNCYMGDYNNIASNGTTRFVTWGDNRNVVTTSAGVTENQPDVFLQSY
jgi:hypothetical protein